MGRGPTGVVEGVIGSALSNSVGPRAGAVPGAELQDLKKVSTLESSFSTSACAGGETKNKIKKS